MKSVIVDLIQEPWSFEARFRDGDPIGRIYRSAEMNPPRYAFLGMIPLPTPEEAICHLFGPTVEVTTQRVTENGAPLGPAQVWKKIAVTEPTMTIEFKR